MVEEENLRRALELAGRRERWAEAILHLLLEFWPMAGRVRDAEHARTSWPGPVSDTQGQPNHPRNRALVDLWRFLMGNKSNRWLEQGALDEAEEIHRQFVDTLERAETPDKGNLAVCYHQLGIVEQERGRLDAAEAWYRKSLAIKEELGNRPGMAPTLAQLGLLRHEQGLRLALAALAIRAELKSPEIAISVNNIRRMFRETDRERFVAWWITMTGKADLPDWLTSDTV